MKPRRRTIQTALIATLLSAIFVGALACSSDDAGESTGLFPIAITDERVETGSQVYASNCASCHGTPGVSQPPLESAPPHDESGHTWHHADRLLYQWTLDRPPLAETMPGFRGVISEDEIIATLAYIKSTWPSNIQEFQNEGSAQYEQQLRENP